MDLFERNPIEEEIEGPIECQITNMYGENWADTFCGWIQNVLNDGRSNAFSVFVYEETCRVFQEVAALHVPGA